MWKASAVRCTTMTSGRCTSHMESHNGRKRQGISCLFELGYLGQDLLVGPAESVVLFDV